MAKLPRKLITKPKPTLEDVKVGDTVFIASTDMLVTHKRDCFLDPTAKYSREPTFFNSLRITRAKDGCHVAVLTKTDWNASASESSVKDWFPVASIVVDLDPELDLRAQSKALEGLEKWAQKRRKGK